MIEKQKVKNIMTSDPAPPLSVNSVVSLNVGGTKFVTTRQTLLSDSDSMLARMFDPESPLQPGETSNLSRDYRGEDEMLKVVKSQSHKPYLTCMFQV